jgi:membrane fusion protein, heavy metal efflux system
MSWKTIAPVSLILLFGGVLATKILHTERRGAPAVEGGVPHEQPLNYPRGPHNGRLLSNDNLQLEITIYETGVSPQFRVYPFDAAMKPVIPSEVNLKMELHRLGNRVDPINFKGQSDYLIGDAVVEEPHSFDVKVRADYKGQSHQWEYSQIEGKVKLTDDQLKSSGVEIATAGPRQMISAFELPGEIKADSTRVAHVVPRLQGVILQALKKAGDSVKQGELLAVLSSRELADAKSTYIETAHHVEFTRVVLEREEALWKKKISPEMDYLQAKRNVEEAGHMQGLAAQKLIALGISAAKVPGILTEAQDNLPLYEIHAPIDGIVLDRDVVVGEAVNADDKIFVIGDLSSLWVEVTVYAKDLMAVHKGQQATIVSTDLGREATGRLDYIGQLVGQENRAAIARFILPNPAGNWRPGLFVTVRLVRESTTVPIAVLTSAIQTFRDWQVVFVRHGEQFEGRPLELGRTDGEWVEVLQGLKRGERYAATNSFVVKAEIGKLGATHDH